MIGPRLQLRQSQQLVMTPQLRQAIQLLQMSNLELDRFLDSEIERNPLLSREAPEGAGDPPESAGDAAPPTERSEAADLVLRADDPSDAAGRLDGGGENLFDRDAGGEPAQAAEDAPRPRAAGAAPPAEGADLAARLPARPSMIDHLAAQIALTRAPPEARAVALALIGDIDEGGYLRADLPETAARLGVPLAAVEAGVALVHQCEPAGIGARDLAECLALQLAERDRLDPAMRALLDNLPLLARADMRALSRRCGVDREDLAEMAAEIRALDPRPGRAFAAPPALAAPPDVLVSAAPDGGWHVELNAETLPRLLVDGAYAARLSAGGRGEARSFVAECAQSAGWLARSLEQRARTILRVATEIVRAQDGFLREGVSALRPMTLRMVADAVGVHESTVSRVAAGKTLACRRGVFELRWFFTQAIAATDGGEAHSAAAIRARLRALIEAENPRRPLSDDALVTTLRQDGVDIARRTVAKYREGLNIPSSVRRRRLNAAAAAD